MILVKLFKLFTTTMLSMLMVTSLAFAEVPSNSVVLGDKAFSVELLFDAANIPDINAALNEAALNGEGMYFKLAGQDTFKDIFTMQDVTQSQLQAWPQITFKAADGNETVYAQGNGDELSSSSKYAYVDVEVASAMPTFKRITVDSSDYEGAASFKVVYGMDSTNATAFGSEVTFMTSESSVEIQILDGEGAVVATGNVGVESSAENAKVSITSTQPEPTKFSVVNIY